MIGRRLPALLVGLLVAVSLTGLAQEEDPFAGEDEDPFAGEESPFSDYEERANETENATRDLAGSDDADGDETGDGNDSGGGTSPDEGSTNDAPGPGALTVLAAAGAGAALVRRQSS